MSNLAFSSSVFLCCPDALQGNKSVYQNICNCNTFLGEMVHFLEKFQGCQYFRPWLYIKTFSIQVQVPQTCTVLEEIHSATFQHDYASWLVKWSVKSVACAFIICTHKYPHDQTKENHLSRLLSCTVTLRLVRIKWRETVNKTHLLTRKQVVVIVRVNPVGFGQSAAGLLLTKQIRSRFTGTIWLRNSSTHSHRVTL